MNPILVVEGEKCADMARVLGMQAVCSLNGASSAFRTDWTPLRGREVIILPDNDEAGEEYARAVMSILVPLGCTVSVRRLPGLPKGGDLVDFVEEHKGLDAIGVQSYVYRKERE